MLHILSRQSKLPELIRPLVSFRRDRNEPTSTMRSPLGIGHCSKCFSINLSRVEVATMAAVCYSTGVNDYSAKSTEKPTEPLAPMPVISDMMKFPRMKDWMPKRWMYCQDSELQL